MIQESGLGGVLSLPDEVLACIASRLHVPRDLLTLALTCKHLKRVVEGAAQTFIYACATDEERSNLPRVNLPMAGPQGRVRRDWGVISKYQQILKHRDRLRFDQLVGDIARGYGDKSQACMNIIPPKRITMRGFGVSNRIMRSGVHRAKFEIGLDDFAELAVGIARPMHYFNKALYKDPSSASPSDDGVKSRYPHEWRSRSKINVVLCSNFGWVDVCKGQESKSRHLDRHLNNRIRFNGTDRVGLVLDMNNRTLSIYKDGNHVPEIISGLDGEYVWIGSRCRYGNDDASFIKIFEWD